MIWVRIGHPGYSRNSFLVVTTTTRFYMKNCELRFDERMLKYKAWALLPGLTEYDVPEEDWAQILKDFADHITEKP